MQTFLDDLPILVVTILLIAMMTLLLIFRVISPSDTLIETIVSPVIAFWFLYRAFKYGVPSTPTQPLVLAQAPLATQTVAEAQAAAPPSITSNYIGVHPNPSAADMRQVLSEQSATNVTTNTPQS